MSSTLNQISSGEIDDHAADVVFIHGLGGSATATWRHGSSETDSWPYWLAEEFGNVRVWALDYPASPSRWPRFAAAVSRQKSDAGHSMALPRRATEVLRLFGDHGLGQRPLLLICHSLGGLLAKQILRKAESSQDVELKKVYAETRAVLFLATPHSGANLASIGSAFVFRLVFGSTVSMGDLKAHSAQLEDLFGWYKNHADRRRIETETFYETRRVKLMLIVNSTSSRPGVGGDPVALGENHLSIAKPPQPRPPSVRGSMSPAPRSRPDAQSHHRSAGCTRATTGRGFTTSFSTVAPSHHSSRATTTDRALLRS